MRPVHLYKGKQSEIVITLYNEPDYKHSSYTLTQSLHPELKTGTPEYGTAFAKTCSDIEELILADLIKGKRKSGADGPYFENIKLTKKGEQAGIEERKRVAEINRLMPEWAEESQKVIEEVEEAERSRKKK